MASKIPNSALARILSEYMSGKDIRARLCMTNTTCDTEIDAIDNLSDYTTIDVYDDSTYVDVALDTETVVANDTDDRGDFNTATDIIFTGLTGNATRDAQGVLLYEYIDGTDANDIPLLYIDFTTVVAKVSIEISIPSSTTNLLQCSQG